MKKNGCSIEIPTFYEKKRPSSLFHIFYGCYFRCLEKFCSLQVDISNSSLQSRLIQEMEHSNTGRFQNVSKIQ
jgi:hypothetical protein